MTARPPRASGAVLAVVVLATGCGVEPQSRPEPVPADRLPSAVDATARAEPRLRGRVWGVRDGRLIPVFVELSGGAPQERVRALLDLGRGQSRAPTLLDARTELVSVERQGDLVEVVLSEQVRSTPPRRLPLVLGQVVFTVTEDRRARRVRVRSGSVELRLRTGRTALERPLQRSDFAGLVNAGGAD